MSERYFAFGANLHPNTLARRDVTPLDARAARLGQHRLVFDRPGLPVVEPAFASVREDTESHVWGVLFDVEDAALERLRAFEGHEYVERSVTVHVGDVALSARTFVTRGVHRERPPSRRYLRVIQAGARHHGLPDAWLAHLDTLPSLYLPVLHDVWVAIMPLVDHLHRRLASPAPRR